MVQWVIKTMVQGLDPWGGVMDTVEWGRVTGQCDDGDVCTGLGPLEQ